MEAGKPELLRGAWAPASAPDWNWANLRSLLRGHTFRDVYLNDDFHYAPADTKAGLYPFVRHRVARLMNAPRNRSAEEVLDGLAAMERISNRRGLNETGVDVAARRRAFWRSTPSAASRCEQPCAQRQADKVEQEQQQEEEKEGRPFGGRHLVWFGDVPAPLRAVLPPPTHPTGARVYASALDASAGLQSAWLSSPGARTHTHYDNDRNFFVQLIGRKRFVLWPPNQTQALCAYPRLHPLWHKSRVVFEAPDARAGTACERYGETSALSVDVGPGDVLYIPPFYWHTVETLTPSLSLSTLSRWAQLYNHMNAVYTHEYFFDALNPHEAKVYGLIAFISELCRRAGDHDLVTKLVEQYAGLEGSLPHAGWSRGGWHGRPSLRRGERRRGRRSQLANAEPADAKRTDAKRTDAKRTDAKRTDAERTDAKRTDAHDDNANATATEAANAAGPATVTTTTTTTSSSSSDDHPLPAFKCKIDARGTPLCRSCVERIRFDVQMAWDENLAHLPSDVRTTLILEWIEELTADAVGAADALRFWQSCFVEHGRPRFFLTKAGTDEHRRLWVYTDNPAQVKDDLRQQGKWS